MNKKVLVITVVSIMVLIGSIAFVSYAAFSADIAGTQEQKLANNGYVTMSCSETTFSVTGANIGAKQNYTCDLNYSVTGTMQIGYDIGLSSVSCTSGATCMISMTKNGTAVFSDKNITTYASSTGTYDTTMTSYKLDSGTLSSSSTVKYVISAWISAVPGNASDSNTTGVCSDTSKTTKETCEAANEVWGTSQTQTQGAATFSFKAKLGAKQINI